MLRIQAIKTRLGAKTPHIVWQFLVFKHNEHEIEKVKAEYVAWGADSFSIAGAQMPLTPHNEGFEPSTHPQYNLYHPEHIYQKVTKRQMQSGRACSWLYGIFLLNPDGKVSPCCAVADEKNDFGKYTEDGDFFSVWNNRKFRQARTLFTQQFKKQKKREAAYSSTQRAEVRLEGMASNLSRQLSSDELICQKCPIPFRQSETDQVITKISDNLAQSFLRENSLRNKALCLLAYIFMGAPNWSELGWRSLLKIHSILTGMQVNGGKVDGSGPSTSTKTSFSKQTWQQDGCEIRNK
jgi:hypothetical protein